VGKLNDTVHDCGGTNWKNKKGVEEFFHRYV
jgi:hypothetical protein